MSYYKSSLQFVTKILSGILCTSSGWFKHIELI